MALSLPISMANSADDIAIKFNTTKKDKKRYVPKVIMPHNGKSKGKQPKLVAYFDTEANIEYLENDIQKQTTNFGYMLVRRRYANRPAVTSDYLRFEDAPGFCDILEKYSRQSKRFVVCGYNVGYDLKLIGVHPELTARGWVLSTFSDRRGRSTYTYRKGAYKIEFADPSNFYKMPLRDLAPYYGMQKMEVDFDTSDLRTLENYCIQDVHILETVMEERFKWLESNGGGSFKRTEAAQAFEMFKESYLEEPIHTNQGLAQKNYEREAYYGGRTEAFHIGELRGEFYLLDINQAYLNAMKNGVFPTEYIGEVQNPTLDDIPENDDNKQRVATVALTCDKAIYPKRGEDRLLFEVGNVVTTLAGPELQLAKRNGHIKHIYRLCVYKASPIFREFATDIHRQRRKAIQFNDRPKALEYKLIGNALYGKFAERPGEWVPKAPEHFFANGEHLEVNSKTGRLTKFLVIDNIRHEYEQNGDTSHTFPLISACIASYVRVKLAETIEKAGWDHVYYCDTDSLIVDHKGLCNLESDVHQTKLGHWKIEKMTDHLVIRGLKDYVFGGTERIKGIPHRHTRTIEGNYQFLQFESMHSAFCNDSHGYVMVRPVTKTLTRLYSKGHVLESGKVIPFRVNEFT